MSMGSLQTFFFFFVATRKRSWTFSFLLWQQAKEENISYVELYIYSKSSTLQEENEIRELFFYTIVTRTRRKKEEENSAKNKKTIEQKRTHMCMQFIPHSSPSIATPLFFFFLQLAPLPPPSKQWQLM